MTPSVIITSSLTVHDEPTNNKNNFKQESNPLPCPCNSPRNFYTSRHDDKEKIKVRSPFAKSSLIGFSTMLLWKNFYVVTSTVGLLSMSLLYLRKHDIIQVNWKKLENAIQCHELPKIQLKVTSKAGFALGFLMAWKFS